MRLKSVILKAVTAAALCGSFSVAFTSRAQVNAEQVTAIGRNVLSMEDYLLAIQYFNQAIKAKPYLADPYYFRALAKLNLDDYQGAEADCTRALELNKFKTEAYKLRGFARQQQGRDLEAIEDYETGLKDNPYDKYFLYYKGVAQSAAGLLDASDTTFRQLERHHPRFDEGAAATGRLRLLQGDTVAALAAADRAISLNRTLLSPWILKAQIHADRRDWPLALKDMDEAILLRPDEPDFYVNRAYLRYNDDDFTGAMADYNYALELDKDYEAALFNRALLRLEVRDLLRAVSDFSRVLELDPANFHALYNRGLAYLQLEQYGEALEDFKATSRRYPRFYPVYYALAESYRGLGNLRQTAACQRRADQLVSQYVADPERNPLDRPTIAHGETNSAGNRASDGETEEEVMEKFNRLVTVAGDPSQTEMAYNDRIKGRVQDRTVQIEPEGEFRFSITAPAQALDGAVTALRELTDFNTSSYVAEKVYLTNAPQQIGEAEFARIAAVAEEHSSARMGTAQRPADHFLRAVALGMLKNHNEAAAEYRLALEGSPGFRLAEMGLALTQQALGQASSSLELQLGALRLYDDLIRANPANVFAWYNKALASYRQRDYSEAVRCLDKVLEMQPGLGAAWYNRGLCYLQGGQKQKAFYDLSKAGELGVVPSYSLLKRMK